jgi:hypothetical protein
MFFYFLNDFTAYKRAKVPNIDFFLLIFYPHDIRKLIELRSDILEA